MPFNFSKSGRNNVDGPTSNFINMAMFKNFQPRERHRIQLRYELFNILSHSSPNLPDLAFNAGEGGMITSAVGRGGPRVTVVGLKFA